ncbi:MAG: ankyrin repeat domain-containing protein [Phycisphaeraceae bacterium]|nr:ankyrin repeat domain-containing protein [Phycisphaeraceae bacterium]
MSERKPVSFIVTVLALAAAGGVLYYYVHQLPTDVGPTVASAGVQGASLHEMAERGDVEALAAQIRNGARLDVVIESGPLWQRGMTPLMSAIVSGQEKAAQTIIDAKPMLDARSRDGRTALIWAAGWGSPGTVQKLLDAGAEKNVRDEANWTALMMAAGRGDPDSVNRLVKSGADINAKNKWGQTALMTALRAGNADKVEILLAAGANPNDTDLEGKSPMHMAADSDVPAGVIVMLVKRGGNVNAQSADGLTPLMIACDRGDIEKVKVLLASDCKTGIKDKYGSTALDWALRRADDNGKAVADLVKSTK